MRLFSLRKWLHPLRSFSDSDEEEEEGSEDEEMNEEDDHYVTIYDWKESHPDHSRIGEYRWHIGSRSNEAVWLVLDVLNAPETMERTDA